MLCSSGTSRLSDPRYFSPLWCTQKACLIVFSENPSVTLHDCKPIFVSCELTVSSAARKSKPNCLFSGRLVTTVQSRSCRVIPRWYL